MSVEVDRVIDYFKATGVPGIVTCTTGGVHATLSLHKAKGTPSSSGDKGLAVDFGFKVGQWNSPGLGAIFNAFAPVEHMLAELIYAGPQATYRIRDGQRRTKESIGADVMAAHHDHCHVAVRRGVFLPAPAPNLPAAPDPNQIPGAIAAVPTDPGYYVVASDGGIFACAGAAFYGSMGGRALSAPIAGMAVTPTKQGYILVGEDGGVFAFGDARYFGSYPGLPPEARRGYRRFVGITIHDDFSYTLYSDRISETYGFPT